MTYQMLTGTVPFPRDSDMAKLWAHVNEDRPRLPASVEHRTVLQAVIDRGMARDPGQRYLSAGDFAAALTGAAAGRTARIQEHMVATGAAAPSAAPTAVLPATAEPPTVPLARTRRADRPARRHATRAAAAG